MSAIAWRPFAAESFAEARALGRPLLVVIGAGWSHATHQLDDESLDEPEIARAIAERFVAVRVEADERPDVDTRYQRLAPSGFGWPLAVLLAEDGTARSLLRRPNRRSFADLLAGRAGEPPRLVEPAPVPGDPIARVLSAIRAAYTPAFGGFGPAPRPPHAPALALLLDDPDPSAQAMALRTLEAMDAGGLHDQLAGGFHRESTDDRWVVPRFEKRAIDQAALLSLYARAFQLTGRARFAEVARAIDGYVERRLADPAGGVACAEDADTGPWDDGSHYTFTLDEARAALPQDELAALQRAYDLYGRGELASDPTRNVLFVAASAREIARELGRAEAQVEALLASARARLLAVREARPHPPIHRALYVLQSAAYARALLTSAASLLPGARDRALLTLARIAGESFTSDRSLRHRFGDPPTAGELHGWLDDLAALGLAALAAFAVTRAPGHLALARELAERLIAEHWDETGGFRDRPRSASGPGELAQPLLPIRDGALASGNALAGRLLLELGRTIGDARYATRLDALLHSLAPRAAALGWAGAGLIHLARDRSAGS